jgi:hypothetical protein
MQDLILTVTADVPEHPLHHEAVELLGLLRKKATNTEVQTYLVILPNVSSGPDEPIPSNVRSMAIETYRTISRHSPIPYSRPRISPTATSIRVIVLEAVSADAAHHHRQVHHLRCTRGSGRG